MRLMQMILTAVYRRFQWSGQSQWIFRSLSYFTNAVVRKLNRMQIQKGIFAITGFL